ncbi:MAG: homoserine O-acetyltransferase [Bacteroidetes bacterium]|nr:MAG: homoserine O-acetyltransferase [Bacteroidota bacterium]PTM09486.1 MAG: homoserine O-acetyltransferase [Bacteroidota bacterium]
MQYLHLDYPFPLEAGQYLEKLTIAYTTHGQRNAEGNNVVWVCHAFTGDANPLGWWPGLIGAGRLLDPQKYFIVCANIIGSCYGTTGPDHYQPGTGVPYGLDFPTVTIRDMVQAHERLREHLGIRRIRLAIGGSMGGQQVAEWAVANPSIFDKICILAANARHSPWGIAFNETQRMALLADNSLGTAVAEAGRKGLEAARAIAILSYRHYQTYEISQQESGAEKIDDFLASSYQRYQGQKLWQRFSPTAYWSLSRSMDTHNVGRNRRGVAAALQSVTADSLIIGVDSDLLFPVAEQSELAQHIPQARFEIISSMYGHDGFLTETNTIHLLLNDFLEARFNGRQPAPLLEKKVAFKQNFVLPGSESF